MGFYFVGTMAYNDNYCFEAAAAKVINGVFDDSLVAEGKQRLEGAHATGLPGGEDDCGNIVGLGTWVIGRYHHLWELGTLYFVL